MNAGDRGGGVMNVLRDMLGAICLDALHRLLWIIAM